jgi:hypothetical protein
MRASRAKRGNLRWFGLTTFLLAASCGDDAGPLSATQDGTVAPRPDAGTGADGPAPAGDGESDGPANVAFDGGDADEPVTKSDGVPATPDAPGVEVTAVDSAPLFDGNGGATDGVPSPGTVDAGSAIDGWRQGCPADQMPDWDAAPPASAYPQPSLTATSLAGLPNYCNSCAPEAAADEASTLYVLGGTSNGRASGETAISISRDGGRSFLPGVGMTLSSDEVVRIAGGRPGRLFAAVTSRAGCTVLYGSWDAAQSWAFSKSVMPGQDDLRLVTIGAQVAIAGVTAGSGTLLVGDDQRLDWDSAAFSTSGHWDLLVDRATGKLHLLLATSDGMVLRTWDPDRRALAPPTVIPGLLLSHTLFAIANDSIVGTQPGYDLVYLTSLGALQTGMGLPVPASATIIAVRGDATGGFTFLASWYEPVGSASTTGLVAISGYVAFHLPSPSAGQLGPPWPVELSRISLVGAYLPSGSGGDIVPLSATLAFATDAYGVSRIGIAFAGRVLDWAGVPDPFPP